MGNCCDAGAAGATAGRRASLGGQSQFVFETTFPMYTVRISDVLSMTAVRAHQDLKADGVLVAFDPICGVAVFVSHQWASRRHPDPAFAQFKTLQEILRNALDGSLRVEVDMRRAVQEGLRTTVTASDLQVVGESLSVWYDYFAVPQLQSRAGASVAHDLSSDMHNAVMSIPAYVERSDLFLILAPEIEHADVPDAFVNYPSWKRRGWCRLERTVRILSPGAKHMLLATTGGLLQEMTSFDYVFESAGDGNFAVEADKESVMLVIAALRDRLLGKFRFDGSLQEFRVVKAAGPMMLRGLPLAGQTSVEGGGVEDANGDPLSTFLEAYAFPRVAIAEAGQSQTYLDEALLRAASAGDFPVVQSLLDSAANLQAKEALDWRDYLVFRGASALHHASGNGHETVVAALLERRADVNARDQIYCGTPLHFAAMGPSPHVLRTLLQHAAQVDSVAAGGTPPLSNAVLSGHDAHVRELLSAGARPRVMLHIAAIYGSGGDIVTMLLEARNGPSPNQEFRPPRLSAQNFIFSSLALLHRCGGGGKLAVLAHNFFGATPFHLTAMFGFLAEARALLRCGADASARNDCGATAADLSALFGHSPQHQAFFREAELKQPEGRGPARARANAAP